MIRVMEDTKGREVVLDASLSITQMQAGVDLMWLLAVVREGIDGQRRGLVNVQSVEPRLEVQRGTVVRNM